MKGFANSAKSCPPLYTRIARPTSALRVGFRAGLVVPVTDWVRLAQLDWIGAERFFLTRLEQIDAENTALFSFTRISFQPQALLSKENDIVKVKIGKLPEGLILNRTGARYGILGTRSVRNLAHGPTRLQPAGSVGPIAPLTKTLLFRYQIAV